MSPPLKFIHANDTLKNTLCFSSSTQQKENAHIISQHISLVENNDIDIAPQKNNFSPIKSILNFLKEVSCKLFKYDEPLSATDPELDNILVQGRIYANDAELTCHALNKPSNISHPMTLSLTSKTGMVLGGILVSSAIVGTGLYYTQQANRKFHYPASQNTTKSFQKKSLLHSGHTQPTANTFHHAIPGSQDDIFSLEKKVSYKAVAKNLRLKTIEARKRLKPQQAKALLRCPLIDDGRKVPLPVPYRYSTQQPEVCLTASFNQRCQVAHQQSRNKRGCFSIPKNMILKISSVLCYCPPPEWLKMTIVAIPVIPLRSAIPSHRSARPKPPEKTKVIIYPDADEMFKHRLSESYAYYVPPKIDSGQLAIGITPPPIGKQDEQGVEQVSLIDCHTARENLTSVEIYRIIGETIDNPIATTLREGQIVIQYDYLAQGCIDNTVLYDATKKIESVIESLLSWIPGYNRVRFITRVLSAVLRAYSDYLDGREVDSENIMNLHDLFLGLAKDILSAANTRSINEMSKSTAEKKSNDFFNSFEYKDNTLIINVGSHAGQIRTQKNLNHLTNGENTGFVFYDYEKKWLVDNNINSNNHIRETFKKSRETWKDEENIYFFKNSSPNLYADAILLRYHGEIYILINNNLYKTTEIQLTDTVFRYIIKDDDLDLPVIHKGESWLFEEKNSPVVSQDLHSFFTNYQKIAKSLVSEHINHQDVSPLTPGREIQFDKHYNEYIKINDQYFKLIKSKDTSYYIESSHDLLALKFADDKFYIKQSLFDDICCFYREPINTIPGVNQNDEFYLDNSIISYISDNKFLSHDENFMVLNDHPEFYFTQSKDIAGGIINKGIDYLYYKNKFIRIQSNGDDSYILGDINDDNENIKIYKNTEGNTYYRISKKTTEWSGLIRRKGHCIVKRQPLSICSTEYFETTRIRHILDINSNHGMRIDNYLETLEPYEKFPAIYKSKLDKTILYYKGEGDVFFHVRKNKHEPFSFTPTQFIIYGKDEQQKINLRSVISSISIIKDFDTKKIIISTPIEAQQTVFDINKKFSDLFLKWQEEDRIYLKLSPDNLQEIVENIPLLNDLSDLNELFNRSGKKVITSIENAEKILKYRISQLLPPGEKLEVNNLKTLENTKTHPVIEDICTHAFKKTIANLKDATAAFDHSETTIDNYIFNILKINDVRARSIFMRSLKSKLERMWMIFDENNKDNIIILIKKIIDEENQNIPSEEIKVTLGFTILNDPLDRIFINAAIIADTHEVATAQSGKKPIATHVISQPNTPTRNRAFFINLISETMIHEAVHALGSPEDYLYLNVNRDGRIENIDDAIKNIETAISQGKMDTIKFEYLSKLYFMSNPLYKDYSITSLTKPDILHRIFQQDSFFRAIVLLNNPDTISLLIRELANTNRLPEEEEPDTSNKAPLPVAD